MNMHLSYKPPSYCRIQFRSGGIPRQFSHMKIFRSLTYPGGACFKGIILQGRQLPSGFPVIGHSFLIIKGGTTGAPVHAPRQLNSPYRKTVRHYIYNTRLPEHPHSPIQKYERHPQVPAIWTRHMESCLDTARFYATSTSMSIVLAPPPMSRFLQALQRCFKSLSIAASVIQSELYHKN